MKRSICIALSLIIIMMQTCFTVGAFAEEATSEVNDQKEYYYIDESGKLHCDDGMTDTVILEDRTFDYFYQSYENIMAYSEGWDSVLIVGNIDEIEYNEDQLAADLMSVSGSSNETTIYNFLVNQMGFNTAAACGVLANIQHESSFNPNATGDSGTSYGICQWHSERWDAMKNWCSSNGYDSTTLTGQLYYLKHELSANNYLYLYNGKTIYNKLAAVSNTADGAYSAGYDWCYYYEVPADKSTRAVTRGNLAKNTYWAEYGDTGTTSEITSNHPYPQLLDYTDLDSSFSNLASAKILPQYRNYVLSAIKYHIESPYSEYRVCKNLLQLYTAGEDGNVVFFFDGCSINLDGATYGFSGYYKSGTRYNTSAVCIVLKVNSSGRPEIVYASANASTMADNVRNASLNGGTDVSITKDGMYNLKTTNHKGYAALNIGITSGASLRCPSSGSSYSATATGINIHARGWDYVSDSTYGSTGCFNVGIRSSFTEYNNFIYSVYGVSNAKSVALPQNGVSSGKNVGIVVIDRYNYKSQLATIFGNDNSSSGMTGEQIASTITEASQEWSAGITIDTEAPTISNFTVTNVSDSSFTIECDLWDNVNTTRVWFNIYGPNDTFKGYAVEGLSNGHFSHTVYTSDYAGAGNYTVHLYAMDAVENSTRYATDVEAVTYTSAPISPYFNISDNIVESMEEVTFTFGAEYATQYYIQIYKDGEKLYSLDAKNSNSYKISFDKNGIYHAYASCSNPLGYIDSEWLTFYIGYYDIGDDFYAYIKNTYSGLNIIEDDNRNASLAEEVFDSKQIWHFVKKDDGGYKIYNTKSGLSLGVEGAIDANGTNVGLFNDTDDLSQVWYLVGESGNYSITSGVSSRVIDICGAVFEAGSNIHMWSHDGNDAQKFSIKRLDSFSNLPIDLGVDFKAIIKSKMNGKYISKNASSIVPSVEENDCFWHFYKQSDGSYTIANINDYLYMEAGTQSDDGSASLTAKEYTGRENQHFFIYLINGNYYIKPAYTDFSLDLNTTTSMIELWPLKLDWAPHIYDIQKVYKCVYNYNGQEETVYGNAIKNIVPKRENYNFVGWSTTENGFEVEYCSGDEYNRELKLYAVWEENAPEVDETAPQIIVNSKKSRPGSTIEVTLEIKNNPGIAGMGLTIDYDDGINLKSVTAGEALSNLDLSTAKDISVKPFNFGLDGTDADSSNGIFAVLTFEVAEDAAEGDYEVTVSYNKGDIYDNDTNDVDVAVVNGVVTVSNAMTGDLSGDEVINFKDVTLLRRRILGGYGVEVEDSICDINKDGAVNFKDVTLMRRFILGGYNVEIDGVVR